MSVEDLFEVTENDTVWDAWLTTVNLLVMLDHTNRIGQYYDFAQARHKIAKLCAMAEAHSIDRNVPCKCGLRQRACVAQAQDDNIFQAEVANLEHFVF